MQLLVRHKVQGTLILPLNYHHILQAVIYKNLENSNGLGSYMHNQGFATQAKHYKLFTFTMLQGKYRIEDKKIIFTNTVEFEVRSPENFLIQILAQNIKKNGLYYGEKHIEDVEIFLADTEVEETSVVIQMQSPMVVYQTDMVTRKTYFFTPEEDEFYQYIYENFKRKYTACYGIPPTSNIKMQAIEVKKQDKYVTNYKGFYITGWKGRYVLSGERKYLNFLYQTGLGGKNSQGFGLFDIV